MRFLFAFVLSATLLCGCGDDADATGGGGSGGTLPAGSTEVGFFYYSPVSSCDVEYRVFPTGTMLPSDRVEIGECLEIIPDDQGLIWAVLDVPLGEWSVYVSVDQPPGFYCAGNSDFVVEDGQVAQVEVILLCG